MGFTLSGNGAATIVTPIPMRRVTVAYTRMGDTFEVKTLQDMIEWQARWNADDLRRLELL